MQTLEQQTREGRLLGGPVAWLIWSLAVVYVIYKFQTQSSYAVLNDHVAQTLSLTLVQVGQLGAIYSITYAAMTILAGGLLDRYGARLMLSFGVATVATGALIFSIAESAGVLFLGQSLMGIGGAFGFPGLAYVTRFWFDIRHFGLIFGVAQTVAASCNALGQAAVGFLILSWSWQDIKLLEAGIGFFILVAIVVIVREPEHYEPQSSQEERTDPFWSGLFADMKTLAVRPLFWKVVLISGLTFGTMLGVGIIWGIKLLVAKGFDVTTATTINASIWFGFGIGALIVQLVSDALRSFKTTAVVFLFAKLAFLLALILLPEISSTTAYTLFVGIGFFTGVNTMCYTMTTRICQKRVSGTAFGFLTCMSFLISGVLMPLPGTIIEKFGLSLNEAASIFPVALIAALLLALSMQETYYLEPAED